MQNWNLMKGLEIIGLITPNTTSDFKEGYKVGFMLACLFIVVVGAIGVSIWNDRAEQRFINDCVASIEHEDDYRGYQASDEEHNGYGDGCQSLYHKRR